MGSAATDPSISGAQTHTYVLKKNKVVDPQGQQRASFHIHGHKYQIVCVAQDVSSSDPKLNPPHTERAPNPLRRDLVVIPAEVAYNLRFVADNPGVWLFHCHIEWHFESGLALVFVEAPEEMQRTISTPPKYMFDQCEAQGILPYGNVVRTFSTTNFSGEALGLYPVSESRLLLKEGHSSEDL